MLSFADIGFVVASVFWFLFGVRLLIVIRHSGYAWPIGNAWAFAVSSAYIVCYFTLHWNH